MSSDPFSLAGRTAVVTGASRGIGEEIAIALARAGADIIGVSSRGPAGGRAEAEITALGRSFTPMACDLSSRESTHELAAALPPVDILVNNAGTIRRKPAAEHDDAIWDEVLETNLSSAFVLAREVGRGMVERGDGAIIFTASLLSFQGGITVPGYAASKHGVAGITKALANEWAASGVRVNAIAPGYIATDNTAALRADETRNRQILERIPAGRWGEPGDIAHAAVFLASPAAAYVNGQVLAVDGGWLAR